MVGNKLTDSFSKAVDDILPIVTKQDEKMMVIKEDADQYMEMALVPAMVKPITIIKKI